MTSAGWRTPSSVTTASGSIRAMPVRTRSTLSRVRVRSQLPLSCRVRLPGGRIVRHHLGQQFGVVADLAGDPLGEHDPGDVVDFADRPLLIGIVGVDPRGVQPLVAARPEQQEPIPAAVERQVPQRPLHAWSHRFVIVRVGEHPLRRALKDGQLCNVVGDRRGDLKSTGARADQRDALAVQVDRVVPFRRMECGPGEGVLRPVSPAGAVG